MAGVVALQFDKVKVGIDAQRNDVPDTSLYVLVREFRAGWIVRSEPRGNHVRRVPGKYVENSNPDDAVAVVADVACEALRPVELVILGLLL